MMDNGGILKNGENGENGERVKNDEKDKLYLCWEMEKEETVRNNYTGNNDWMQDKVV